MEQFPMITSAGHILLDYYGKNYVIDTGSPASFSFEQGETLRLDGKDYTIGHGMFGVNQPDIENLVQAPVSGIIGLDLLIDSGSITFSWKDNCIFMGGINCKGPSVRLPITVDPMYVTVRMTINGSDVSMLLDTGAKIDYLDPEYLDLTKEPQTGTDFNPMLGHMEVTGYETTYRFGEKEYTTVAYQQPGMLGLVTGMLSVSGIVGMSAFFMAGNIVRIDFQKQILEIFP